MEPIRVEIVLLMPDWLVWMPIAIALIFAVAWVFTKLIKQIE